MVSMRAVSLALDLLALSLLGFGCRPDYETEQLRITLDDDAPGGFCAGDLHHLQDEVDRIERILDMRMRRPVDLVYFTRLADCKISSEGCYFMGRHRIHTNAAAVSHELVHAVTGGCAGRRCDRFFEEGVAEALSGAVRFPRVISRPSDNLDRSSSPSIDYGTAGHFTRWLLEEQGVAKIRAMLDSRDFEEVYGESLTSAEQRWMSTAPWLYPAHAPCPHESLSFDADGGHEVLTLDCDEPDVRSGAGEGMGTCRTFEIEREGLYTYRSSASTWIERCQHEVIQEPPPIEHEAVPAAHNFNRPLQYFAPDEEHEALFRAGQHKLCVIQETKEPTMVEISLSSTATTVVRP